MYAFTVVGLCVQGLFTDISQKIVYPVTPTSLSRDASASKKRRRDEDILSHVTLFKSVEHLKVDARGPLVSRLVPGFPARLLNSGKIRCSFEELLSRRKTFEGTRPPWASWLLCLAILKFFFLQLGLSKGNDRWHLMRGLICCRRSAAAAARSCPATQAASTSTLLPACRHADAPFLHCAVPTKRTPKFDIISCSRKTRPNDGSRSSLRITVS